MSIRSWLRTHRKKIVTHSAITVAFMLLIIFVSAPLFDRLEGISGEAQLHQVQLPAETTNMRWEINDISTDGHTGVDILGWAFVDGQDCQNRELYIVLKSAQRTYVFDTKVDLRPDLFWIDTELVSDVDYSGFRALIPAREISNGEYIVGFYIKYGGMEALYYTDRVVIKSQDSVTWSYSTSKLVEVTLPEESGNMQCNITEVEKQTDGEHFFLEIHGWAFLEGYNSTKDSRTYVILKSANSTYVFDTIPTFAWGVARQFGNYSNWDLDYSGFVVRISGDQLEDATYQIGIYIVRGDMEAFRYIGRVVTCC